MILHSRTLLARIFAAIILSLVASQATRAADVTWDTPQQISGSSDVSLTGSLIGAFNVGDTGVPGATVNTVSFQSFAMPAGNGAAVSGGVTFTSVGGGFGVFNSNTDGASTMAPFINSPAGYQTLLSSYVVPLFAPVTLTMAGLIVGAQYQLEFWSNLSSDHFSYSITATGGINSVDLNSNDGHADGGLGEWVTGSFTADALTQSISFLGDGDGGFLNGFQLRRLQTTAVPESGMTFVLLALGLGGLMVLQRILRRNNTR